MFQVTEESIEMDSTEFLESIINDNVTRFNNLSSEWVEIEGQYESNTWRIKDLNIIYNRNIKFSLPINNSLKQKYVESLKSWCIFMIERKYSVATIAYKIGEIVNILKLTSYFNEKYLNVFKENYFSKDFERNSIFKKVQNLVAFHNYTNIDISPKYLNVIYDTYDKYSNSKSGIRTLPRSKDILKFSLIVEDFFTNNLTDDYYFKYFPVLLWWKLTNIIPLRISEFCLIKSNCLNPTNEGYILKLPRSKRMFNRDLTYDQILISDDLAAIILEYKRRVAVFKESTTLINYLSTAYDFKSQRYRKIKSENKDYFLLNSFNKCLEDFYQEIVVNSYGYEIIDKHSPDNVYADSKIITSKINPNDTRHFAFLNLMIQGYHPSEIARLGGHKDIYTQYAYHNHIEYWVDADLMDLFISEQPKLSELASNFYFDMMFNNVVLNTELDIEENKIPLKIGYCIDPNQNCMVDEHYLCPYWRIEKADFEEHYMEIKQILNSQKSNFKLAVNKLLELYKSEIFSENEIMFSEQDSKYNFRLKENANQVKQSLYQLIYLKNRIKSYE